MMVSKEFVFDVAELRPGAALPLHRHDQAKIDYVLSGIADVRVGPRCVQLEAGSCVYYPPGVPHAVAVQGSGVLRYVSTYACERLGSAIDAQPADGAEADRAPLPDDTWVHWKDAEPWAPIEPVKGLRVRFRRVMSRERPVELIAGVAQIDPSTHYTRHFHDQAELYHIVAGNGLVFVGDAIVEVHPGSSLYIPARMVHGADSLGREPLTIFYVYGCERAGHAINWTAVEEIYTDLPQKGLPR